MPKIDHAAVRTTAYEDAQKFFEDVFEMHMWREIVRSQPANAGTKKESTLRSGNYQHRRAERLRPYFHCGRLCGRNYGKDQSIPSYANQRSLVFPSERNQN